MELIGNLNPFQADTSMPLEGRDEVVQQGGPNFYNATVCLLTFPILSRILFRYFNIPAFLKISSSCINAKDWLETFTAVR